MKNSITSLKRTDELMQRTVLHAFLIIPDECRIEAIRDGRRPVIVPRYSVAFGTEGPLRQPRPFQQSDFQRGHAGTSPIAVATLVRSYCLRCLWSSVRSCLLRGDRNGIGRRRTASDQNDVFHCSHDSVYSRRLWSWQDERCVFFEFYMLNNGSLIDPPHVSNHWTARVSIITSHGVNRKSGILSIFGFYHKSGILSIFGIISGELNEFLISWWMWLTTVSSGSCCYIFSEKHVRIRYRRNSPTLRGRKLARLVRVRYLH